MGQLPPGPAQGQHVLLVVRPAPDADAQRPQPRDEAGLALEHLEEAPVEPVAAVEVRRDVEVDQVGTVPEEGHGRGRGQARRALELAHPQPGTVPGEPDHHRVRQVLGGVVGPVGDVVELDGEVGQFLEDTRSAREEILEMCPDHTSENEQSQETKAKAKTKRNPEGRSGWAGSPGYDTSVFESQSRC